MKSQVAEQIENLKQRVKELNVLLMESKGLKDRDHIEAEIRAVNLLLSHYQAGLGNTNEKS